MRQLREDGEDVMPCVGLHSQKKALFDELSFFLQRLLRKANGGALLSAISVPFKCTTDSPLPAWPAAGIFFRFTVSLPPSLSYRPSFFQYDATPFPLISGPYNHDLFPSLCPFSVLWACRNRLPPQRKRIFFPGSRVC